MIATGVAMDLQGDPRSRAVRRTPSQMTSFVDILAGPKKIVGQSGLELCGCLIYMSRSAR